MKNTFVRRQNSYNVVSLPPLHFIAECRKYVCSELIYLVPVKAPPSHKAATKKCQCAY